MFAALVQLKSHFFLNGFSIIKVMETAKTLDMCATFGDRAKRDHITRRSPRLFGSGSAGL
jgi:hypothetical protein